MTISPAIERLVYGALVAFSVAGVAAVYGRSEGLITLPAPAIAFAAIGVAAPEAHYSPGENLEAIDVGLIDQASETIDMAAYVLTDVAIAEALADAAARGVRIRLFRFPSDRTDLDVVARLGRLADIKVRFKKGPELMHLKSYCVDGRLLRAGAANFSASGLKRQNNDLWIFRGPRVCDGFERAFAAMWSE